MADLSVDFPHDSAELMQASLCSRCSVSSVILRWHPSRKGGRCRCKSTNFMRNEKISSELFAKIRRKLPLVERGRHGVGEDVGLRKKTSLAKGVKKPANGEKGTGKRGERYVLACCHRPPSQIRAGALTSWSTRPYMLERTAESDFYSLELPFLGKYSQRRLSRTFHRRGWISNSIPSVLRGITYS